MDKKNPDERAKELHEKIKDPRKKRSTTTAVGSTKTETSIVRSLTYLILLTQDI